MAISASTKKLIILFALLSAVVLVLLIVQSEQVIAPSLGKVEGYRKFEYQRGSVFVAGHRIEVEIAQTDEQRTQGLLGHKPLSSTAGMLFVFDEARRYPFHMRGMKFPIDIIWIDNNLVVDISARLQPDSVDSAELYIPIKPVDMALELKAGTAKKLGIKIGSDIKGNGPVKVKARE